MERSSRHFLRTQAIKKFRQHLLLDERIFYRKKSLGAPESTRLCPEDGQFTAIVSYLQSWTPDSHLLFNNQLFPDTDSERTLVVAFNRRLQNRKFQCLQLGFTLSTLSESILPAYSSLKLKPTRNLFDLHAFFESKWNYNTHLISWDSCDVFCPSNVGFCEVASQKPEIQHWEGKNTTFCWNMGVARGVPTQRD